MHAGCAYAAQGWQAGFPAKRAAGTPLCHLLKSAEDSGKPGRFHGIYYICNNMSDFSGCRCFGVACRRFSEDSASAFLVVNGTSCKGSLAIH